MDTEGNFYATCQCNPPKTLMNDEECEDCGYKLDKPMIEKLFSDKMITNLDEVHESFTKVKKYF